MRLGGGPLRRWFGIRRLATVAALVAAWCALWGEVSTANLLSGLAVAVAVIMTGAGTPGAGGVRFGPLAAFFALVVRDLVVSTAAVAYEVLTPTDYTDESIVAVEVPPAARRHLLLLVVAVTVSPGTAVVDADPDTGRLYVHMLHDERRDAYIAHIDQLAQLACRALPVPPAPVVEESA